MVAYSGSCLCGKVRYIGSSYSINFLVPEGAFRVTAGTPKAFSKVAESGVIVVSYFCSDCGSMMWRESPNSGTNKVVKAGTLDDSEKIISAAIFDAEIFTRSRIEWVQPIAGASQDLHSELSFSE
ncbi:Mss4-like protein [Trichoderma evansii]